MMKNLNRFIGILIICSIGFLSVENSLLAQGYKKPGKDANKVEIAKYYGLPNLKGGRNVIPSLGNIYCTQGGTADIYIDPANLQGSTANIIWTIYTGNGPTYEEHPGWVTSIGAAPNNGVQFDPSVVPEAYHGIPVVFSYEQFDGVGVIDADYDYTYVQKNPTAYNFGSDAVVCSGTPVDLTLDDSEVGMEYFLYRNTVLVSGVPVAGTGNSLDFTVGAAGTYTVEARNAVENSCTAVMTGSAEVTVNSNPIVDPGLDQTICEGQTANLSATSDMDGTGNMSYQWTDGTNTQAGATWDVSPSVTTTYTVTGTNTVTGCSDVESVDVIVNTNPTITAGSNSPVCDGSDINLTSTPLGGSGTYSSFSWTGPNGFTSSAQNAVIVGSSAVNAGDYFVTVADNNGCLSDATDFTTVVISDRPTVSVVYNSPVCEGTDLVLTATPAGGSGTYTSYAWTKDTAPIAGETGATLTIDPTAAADAGTYGVVVTDNSGCVSDESTTAVIIHTLPIPTASNDGPACEGETVNLSGGPNGLTYTWTGPGSFSSAIQNPALTNVTLADAGVYTLMVTDGNTCEQSITTTVVVNSNPTIVAASNSPVCQGSPLNLSSTPAGGSGIYTGYSWTGPNGFTANTQNAVIATAALVNSGDYFVAVTDDNGCSTDGTDLVNVLVNNRPTVSVGYNAPVCEGNDLVLTATPAGGSGTYASYAWTKDSAPIAGETGATLTIDPTVAGDAGTYGVIVTDNSGCVSDESTAAVIIHTLPIPTAGNDGPACEGETINLSGGPNGLTYAWTGPDSFSSSVQDPALTNISLADAGVYTLRVTDGNTCEQIMTTTVVVNSNPTIAATSNSPVCEGLAINLSSTPAGGSGTYTGFSWTGPNGFTATTQNAVIAAAVPANAGDYFVTVTDDNGCSTAGTDLVTVSVNSKPTVSLGYNSPVCLNTSLVLTATAAGGSGSYVNYVWTKDGSTILGENASTLTIDPALVADAGTYGVIVEGNSGCSSDEVTQNVVIESLPIVTAGNDSPACDVEAVNLTGGPGSLTYSWTGPNSFTSVAQNPTINPIGLAGAGTYTMVGTDANGCSASATTDVIVNTVTANISVSAPSPGVSTICAGTAVTFNAAGTSTDPSPNFNYDFHLVRGASDTSVQNGTGITYTTSALQDGDQVYVIITDLTTTCDDTSPSIIMTVVANPVPVLTIVSAGGSNTICAGQSVDFSATTGYGRYVFLRNGTDILQDSPSNTYSTDVFTDGDVISVTAYTGTCSGTSTGVTITVNPLPTPSLVLDNVGRTTVCENETVDFTASATGNGPFTYLFYVGTGGIFNPQGSFSSTATFSHSSTDDFSVYVEIRDGNSCEVASNVIDIVISKPVAGLTADKTIICENEEVVFTGTGGVNYNFFVDGLSQQDGASDEFRTSTLTNGQNVSLEITDAFGCTATHGGIVVTVNLIPIPTLISSDVDNIICATDEVTYTAGGGDTYEWFIEDALGTVTSVQGPNNNSSFVTTTLNDGDIVSVRVSYTATSCFADAARPAITVNALPVAAINASPGSTVIAGTEIIFTGSGGTEYEFSVNNVVVQGRSVDDTYNVSTLVDGDIVSVDVYDGNDCMASADLTVSILEGILPLDVLTTGPEYCEGDGGVSIYVDTPQHGITYEMFRTSDNSKVEPSIMFDSAVGNPVQWDDILGNDEYRVEAFYTAVPTGRVEMNNRIDVVENSLPVIYDLTTTGTEIGCNGGAGHIVSLQNSDATINYILELDDTPVETLVGVNGQLDFSAQLGIGTYTVVAENPSTTCTSDMNGTFEIQGDGSDVAFNLSVVSPADPSDPTDGRYCAGSSGVELVLDGSLDNTVNYKLYLDGTDTGVSVPGANGAISFGTLTTEGTYTVRVESASGCQFPMNGSAIVSIIDLPIAFNVVSDNVVDNTSGHYCIGDVGVNISVEGQEVGVEYSLFRDATFIETLTGGPTPGALLTFTGPFTTEGVYSVSAMVPEVGCVNNMSNNIQVVIDPLPVVYDALNDDDEYCTGESAIIYINFSEADVEYTWRDIAAPANIGAWQSGNGSRLDFTITATGDYEIIARRTDGITSCMSVMNNTYSITEKLLPVDVVLSLGDLGTGCDNGDSLYVESSELGVEYTLVKVVGGLYFENPDVNPIIGDGNDLGFAERVVDKNATYALQAVRDGCSIYTTSTIFVDVPGVIERQTVTGTGEICNGDPGVSFGLANTEAGVNYQLWRTGDGAFTEELPGTGLPLTFGPVINEGEYYVRGVIAGTCDLEMANRVDLNINDLPIAYPMFGSGQTCDLAADGALIGLVASEDTYTYRLQVDDGSGMLTVVTTIPGRVDNDSLKYIVNTEGTYTFMAISDKGCTSNMNGSVVVAEVVAPLDQVIDPTIETTYCGSASGVELKLTNNELDVTYQVRDASNNVMSEVVGTNIDVATPEELIFPNILTAGSYTIWKTRGGDACESITNGGNTVDIVQESEPTDHNVLVDNTRVCGAVDVMVFLEDFEPGRSYRIESSVGPILDTITGADRDPVSWLVNEPGATSEIYEVIAMSASGACDKSMGTQQVIYSESPDPFIVFTELNGNSGVIEYCYATDSVTIGIETTQVDVGYLLIDNVSGSTLDFINGTGNREVFNKNYGQGSYVVRATLFTTGCSIDYGTSIDITMLELPESTYLLSCSTPDGGDCYVGDYVIMDNSELGIEYSLYKDFDITNPIGSVKVGDGNPINFDDEDILIGGSYYVQATNPVTGCVVWMDDDVLFYDSPLIARNDSVSMEKGSLIGSVDVGFNDIFNIAIDEIGTGGDEGNIRFNLVDGFIGDDGNPALDENGDLVKVIGVAAIDSITGILTYEKLPGFFGLDSIRYTVRNRDYSYRSDEAIVYFYVGNKEIDDDRTFLIPNAFSPNGDDFNDYFRITGINKNGVQAEKSSLEVFNRWGTLVYRSKGNTYGEDDQWWDGTSTEASMVSIGADLPNGTYYYVFVVEVNIDGAVEKKEYNGYIELRR
ncbi:gliding motility-associated C-terminal domain-containing protein [Labilibacter marinus]|uniref:gliding motility-associated C-terminal domain-containing protein n=1 Tax=Labilibacter marinus TaxID=1477105 RepID=UPI0011798DCA|nr:gliding motility-associated C-terminal domain-containing protein [Labilibacter marinus]